MANLQLGVLDVSYSARTTNEDGSVSVDNTTTGDVAEILEGKYHVMETFFMVRKAEIARYLAESVSDAIQDIANGASIRMSPTYAAEQRIEAEFRSFLDSGEMEQYAAFTNYGIGPVPGSGAAQAGVSHRRKAPRAKRRSRPMFIDTGLYRSSFRAVVNIDLSGRSKE